MLLFFVLILFFSNLFADNTPQVLSISYNVNSEIIIVVDSSAHSDYGFKYPVTYKMIIPENSEDLITYFKFRQHDEWNKLTAKTSEDFFNGVNCVRYEYENDFAFVSIGFSELSDSIILKISDDEYNYKRCYFDSICKYYDNRRAVVCATADDLGQLSTGFEKALHAFRSRKLWLSCGPVTSRLDETDWANVQSELDKGYMEIDSHSRTHVPIPYDDYDSEVYGSRDDIINNLDLPSTYTYKNNEYVYCYIYPYGNYNNTLDRTTGAAKYLINRKVTFGEDWYTEWSDSYDMFLRVGVVQELGPNYGGVPGVSDIEKLNSKFDEVISNGNIYHISIHPNNIEAVGDWEADYMTNHLDYISGRKEVWYVGFGQLYVYNFLRTQILDPNLVEININIFLEGCFDSDREMNTTIRSSLPSVQPYNSSPWNYNGDEEIKNSIPDMVDWVLVELRAGDNMENIITQRAAVLLKDGSIKDLDGKSALAFFIVPDEYFIAIKHRNHLPIMSSSSSHLEIK